MAETFDQIQSDIKDAMRARDSERRDALRMIFSNLKKRKIDQGGQLSEDDIVDALATEAKRRREAAASYREGDREELAAKEEFELTLIEEYLPSQLSDDEAADLVDEVIAEVGAEARKDMGRVMGAIMPRIKGRYEGSKIKDIVLAKLA